MLEQEAFLRGSGNDLGVPTTTGRAVLEVPVLFQGWEGAAQAASLHKATGPRERSGLLVEIPAGYCNPPEGKTQWMCWGRMSWESSAAGRSKLEAILFLSAPDGVGLVCGISSFAFLK